MSEVGLPTALDAGISVRKAALLLAAVVGLFFLYLPASAQVNTGRISGAITDQSGGAIAGAKITITNVGRGESRVLTADAAGQYAAPNLDPGAYTMRTEFAGFQAVDRQNIDVGVGADVRVDVTLQPGAQTQTVTVTEALPVVNTTNAQTGGALDNQVLTSLPISGRNYRWQQDLVEGVTILPGHGSSTTNVNGTTDGEGDNMILDGVYGKTQFTGEFTFGGSGEAGDATLIPLDMIQEVDVITNPKAEYGYVSGSTLNVGLKSGTNNLHGSAWAFGRQGPSLEAKNAFASSNHPLAFEQYGGTVGGPIKKDKIFYQLGYEGFFEDFTTVVHDTAPALTDTSNTGLSIPDAIAAINTYNAAPTGSPGVPLNELSVNLAGCNWNNAGITSTVVANVVAACANGNQYGAPGLWNGNLGVLPNDGYSGTGLGKVDYHINDHHDLNGSFGQGYYYEQAAANNGTSILDNWWEQIYGVKAQESRIAWVWTPNTSWLNEFRWGLDLNTRPVSTAECTPKGNPFAGTSFGSNGVALGLGASEGNYGGPNYQQSYGFNSGAPACGFPTTVLSAPVSAQLGQSKDRGIQDNDDQFTDSLSYTRGAHQFKFGADIRALTFIGAKTTNQQDGTIDFGQSGAAAFTGATSLEDFLVGVPSEEIVRGGDPNLTMHIKYMAFFAQDDWRIKRKLTLNLGYRDEVFTPDTTTGFSLGNFNPTTPSGITAATSVWNTMNRPEPRFGFVYDLTGKGTTVIRGSIGILGDVQRQSSIISGGGAFDLSAAPTGELLYSAAGVPIMSPGNGQSSIVTLLPVSGTSGVTKGIVISSPIPWTTNAAYNHASPPPVFPSPVPEACGNGLQVPGSSPAVFNPSPCGMYQVPQNMAYNHYMFWNVNVQHAFTNNLSLDVGYVASRTWDLQQYVNINQAAPNANTSQANASYEQSVAPYEARFPWFSTITVFANAGNVNFKSLQAHLQSRLSHGLTFNVNYTLQENEISEGAFNANVPVTSGTNGPYSDNMYPAQHLAVSYSYAIPGIKAPGQMLQGWTISGAINILSAIPYCTSDSKDDTSGAGAASTTTFVGAGCGTGTPWSLYGPAAPISQLFGRAGTLPCYGVVGSKFTPAATPTSNGCIPVAAVANMPTSCIAAAETEAPSPGSAAGAPYTTQLAQLAAIGCYSANGSAIVPPSQGTYGTMPFYALHGAGFSQVNIDVEKQWTFKERYSAQFKFDVFNLFNRTMYYGDGVNIGSPNTFGQSTGTPDVLSGGGVFSNGGPRAMQLGLKLIF